MASLSSIKEKCGLLATAYFPPIEFFAAAINCKNVYLEACESYQKQSYRTRCHIYTSSGIFVLKIPVLREGIISQSNAHTHKIPIKEIKIDYSEPWVMQHERALKTAYMNSPFFEYYYTDIFKILDNKEIFLFDLNYKLINLISELIGDISTIYEFTSQYSSAEYIKIDSVFDCRNRIHPKFKGESILKEFEIEKPYFQVFAQKQGFIPNLSILDLLFNEGPNSISFLR